MPIALFKSSINFFQIMVNFIFMNINTVLLTYVSFSQFLPDARFEYMW